MVETEQGFVDVFPGGNLSRGGRKRDAQGWRKVYGKWISGDVAVPNCRWGIKHLRLLSLLQADVDLHCMGRFPFSWMFL